MHVFHDKTGRAWAVAVNGGSVIRVKAHTGVNLPELFGDGFRPFREFVEDIEKVVNVLYALCMEQASTEGIGDEQFGALLDGDTLEAGLEALAEELVDFSPKHLRPARRGVLEKTREFLAEEAEEAARRIGSLTRGDLVARLNASPGNAPESSGSTPGPSPSASSA